MAMDSPNPNITHERIVIQVRTLVETRFASPSIGGLLFRCALPLLSLGVWLSCMLLCAATVYRFVR